MPSGEQPRPPYKYRLSYDVHIDGITKDELEATNLSGTDAILWASILYSPDGSLSIQFISQDGRTGKELDDNEWFKVFLMLAKRLGDSTTLSPIKREFAQIVFEGIRQVLLKTKEREAVEQADKD
jgi:hypothetical protein